MLPFFFRTDRRSAPDRRDDGTDLQVITADKFGHLFGRDVPPFDVVVGMIQEQVDPVEADAFVLGVFGQLKHLPQFDHRIIGRPFPDHARPGRVM